MDSKTDTKSVQMFPFLRKHAAVFAMTHKYSGSLFTSKAGIIFARVQRSEESKALMREYMNSARIQI